jgi:hypothetical protein
VSVEGVVPEPPEGWREVAACLNTNPDWFYADTLKGRPPTDPVRKAQVYEEMRWRHLCPRCPARADCLAHALLHRERWGVWGGMTPAGRRNIEEFLVGGLVTWVKLTKGWSNIRTDDL